MSNDNPYSNYATDKELYEDFLTEEMRGQAMYMQDHVSDLCEDGKPNRWYYSGFSDILGHLIEMIEFECEGDTKKELKKRKEIARGALDAINTLIEMTKEGDFKKDP